MPFLLIVAFLLILIVFVISFYNSLVRRRNQVRNAWKQIDVQLKRRHDLIPNLVNTVRGQMEFEKETLERVISARAAAVNAKNVSESIEKEGELSSALSRLIAVSENYPQLKSNEAANNLMEELTTTENQITFSRQFYNDLATTYNSTLESFPTYLFAKDMRFNLVPLFQVAKKEEREVPVVNLSMK